MKKYKVVLVNKKEVYRHCYEPLTKSEAKSLARDYAYYMGNNRLIVPFADCWAIRILRDR